MNYTLYFDALKSIRNNSNVRLKQYEPIKLTAFLVFSTLSFCWLYDLIYREEPLKKRLINFFFKCVRKIPPIRKRIEKEISQKIIHLEESFNTLDGVQLVYHQSLPDKGFNAEEIELESNKYLNLESIKWKDGAASGTVYVNNDELNTLMTKVYSKFMWTNPLHPDIFPDIRKMEAEIVRMCLTMYNGDKYSCGTTTSGGTESIILAMKSYRDLAYERGIRIPEMVVPVTGHAAFDKAAQYFRIKIHHVKVDPVTYKVDMVAFKRAISKNTCVLVGSAPSFPQGVVDPIEEIAALGLKYNIPVHVDCCLGGFLLPFMEKAGLYLDERFDFRLRGVTSISCDTHKYGYAPKGSSVIMYRSNFYRQKQFFVQTDWPGGVYASPTISGSRAGAIIATCWATLMYFGLDGYVKTTKEVILTTLKIKEGLLKIPGLKVLGDPKVCVIALASDKINIYNLLDKLREIYGWQLNPLQFPHCIHIAVTHVHTQPGVAERFVADVAAQVEILSKEPTKLDEGSAAIYGMSQSLPDRSLVQEIAAGFIGALYNTNNS